MAHTNVINTKTGCLRIAASDIWTRRETKIFVFATVHTANYCALK
jgi:hypothetical protein